MKILIVTGMSGAGKSIAIKSLEDIGYYCIDNMPPNLINEFIALLKNSTDSFEKVAFVIDARSGTFFKKINENIRKIDVDNNEVEILFLDASNQTLIKRFKETKRNHPLSKGKTIEEGIALERIKLEEIKNRANYYLDTTDKSVNKFKEEIRKLFTEEKSEYFEVILESFGFKRGIPADSDLVFDVRYLPNPFYVETLREKTGNDYEVFDYVFSFEESNIIFDKILDLVLTIIPQYLKEGRNSCVISIGCTGGKHRSVSFVNRMNELLLDKGYKSIKMHRDINK